MARTRSRPPGRCQSVRPTSSSTRTVWAARVARRTVSRTAAKVRICIARASCPSATADPRSVSPHECPLPLVSLRTGGLQCSCKAGYRLGATACQVCSGQVRVEGDPLPGLWVHGTHFPPPSLMHPQASTMDRTACISCDIHKNATLDTTTLNCKCPYVNQALCA